MRPACVMVLVAACGSSAPAASDAAIDVRPDAYVPPCEPLDGLTPVAITGTSPGGTLDRFRFARAYYNGGDCEGWYNVVVTPSNGAPGCGHEPSLRLGIQAPFAAPNPHAATTAYVGPADSDGFVTNQVTFEATQLDEPTVASPRIYGHFVSHDLSWVFDFEVDLMPRVGGNCI